MEPTSKRIYDINGWYTVEDNPITGVGVYQYYGCEMGIPGVEPDKIYNVYRPAESLSDPEFLESIKLLPWIDDHVMLGQQGKPAEEKGIEGIIGEQVYFKGGSVYGNVKVFSEDLKHQIESGKKQLSLGYTSRYQFKSGTYNDQKYDFIQRDLRGNHLALVLKGRMGSEVAVLDEQLSLLNDDGGNMNEEELAEQLAKHRGITFDAAMQIVKGATPTMDTDPEGIRKMVQDECAKAFGDMKGAMKETMDACLKDMGIQGSGMDSDLQAENETLTSTNKDLTEEVETLRGKVMDSEKDAQLEVKKELAERLSKAVGVFDHAAMSLDAVAKYGLEKFELKAPAGAELVVLDTHLNAVESSGGRFAVEDSEAQPAKPSAVTSYLEGSADA